MEKCVKIYKKNLLKTFPSPPFYLQWILRVKKVKELIMVIIGNNFHHYQSLIRYHKSRIKLKYLGNKSKILTCKNCLGLKKKAYRRDCSCSNIHELDWTKNRLEKIIFYRPANNYSRLAKKKYILWSKILFYNKPKPRHRPIRLT